MVELPASVRYVKNGAGGRWWPDAKASGRIHAGWSAVPDKLIRSADAAAIGKVIGGGFGAKPGATQHINALLTLLDRPSRHLWITFEDGCMCWATAREGVTIVPAASQPALAISGSPSTRRGATSHAPTASWRHQSFRTL